MSLSTTTNQESDTSRTRRSRTAARAWIFIIAAALTLCVPLTAAEPEGKTYEVTVSVVTPGGTFPVACTCLTFDPNPPACLRSDTGLLSLWAFSSLDLDPGKTEVQATTGVALPSMCGGPRSGFEGISLYGTVDGTSIALEAVAEVAPNVRLLTGFENDSCSLETCQIVP